jgi:hypothetical protein
VTDTPHTRSRTRIRYKKKINKKKQKRVRKLKKAAHNIFLFLMLLFLVPATYFLFWGLIIEPNLPRHIYGPGDFMEFIYLLVSLTIILISYLMILLIKYKPLEFWWWDNLKLFYSVGFSLDKYAALKGMGIQYSHQKKKLKSKKYRHADNVHKSITE